MSLSLRLFHFENWATFAFVIVAIGLLVFGYVRTAVGPDASERLAKEESFYRDLHDGYRNHFARLGEPEGTVGIAAADGGEAQTALGAYDALDVPVVRGLASAKVEPMVALAEAAAE